MEDGSIRKRARLEVRPSFEHNQPSILQYTDTLAETITSLKKQLEEERQQNRAHAKTIADLEAKVVELENEVYCEQDERGRLGKELFDLRWEMYEEQGERYRLVEEHCGLRHKLEDEQDELLEAHGDDVYILEGKLKRRGAEIQNLEEQISELKRKLDYEMFECKRGEIKYEEEITDLEIELEREREAHRRTKDELRWALKMAR